MQKGREAMNVSKFWIGPRQQKAPARANCAGVRGFRSSPVHEGAATFRIDSARIGSGGKKNGHRLRVRAESGQHEGRRAELGCALEPMDIEVGSAKRGIGALSRKIRQKAL